MKTNFATIAALFSAFMWQASTQPVDTQDLAERINSGEAVLCSHQNQCSTIRTPSNSSLVCTDFSGSLEFLNHNLANVTIVDVACQFFSDFGCTGTGFGGDFVVGGPIVINLTKFYGRDISGSVSSINCAFVNI